MTRFEKVQLLERFIKYVYRDDCTIADSVDILPLDEALHMIHTFLDTPGEVQLQEPSEGR